MATLKVTNIKNESFAGDQLYLKTDGKLGIGTTSPSSILHTKTSGGEGLRLQGTATNSFIRFTDASNNSTAYLGHDTDFKIANQTNTHMRFYTNDQQRMHIKSDGNIGIGTTNPTNLLEISGGLVRCLGTASARFTVNNGAAEGFFGWNSGTLYLGGASALLNIAASGSNNIQLETNSSTRMTIKSDGDIEVGGNLKTNNLSGRNLVINGAMQVAQRGTSSTDHGHYTIDRWAHYRAGVNENPTFSQADVASGTTPYELGFRKSLKTVNGNQTSGAGADDYISLDYKWESQDLAKSGWNYTSTSSYVTLSFWVKSSVAQNFYFHIKTVDGTAQNYPMETGSLSANTWTKITKTIPGNSNLQFDNNNGAGLQMRFILYRGINKTGSITLNQWAAFNTNIRVPDNTTTWYTTNDATFELTGAQLEVGSIATEFEHRSYGEELALCKRYYEYIEPTDGWAMWSWQTDEGGSIIFFDEKRATPTASIVGSIANGVSPGSGSIGAYGVGGWRSLTSLSLSTTRKNSTRIFCGGMNLANAGDSFGLYFKTNTGIKLEAEL